NDVPCIATYQPRRHIGVDEMGQGAIVALASRRVFPFTPAHQAVLRLYTDYSGVKGTDLTKIASVALVLRNGDMQPGCVHTGYPHSHQPRAPMRGSKVSADFAISRV